MTAAGRPSGPDVAPMLRLGGSCVVDRLSPFPAAELLDLRHAGASVDVEARPVAARRRRSGD